MAWRNYMMLAWLVAAVGVVSAWTLVSPDELDASIKANELVVVAYIAAADEKCKNFEPEWRVIESAAKVPILTVSCDEHSALCETRGASSYPHIQLAVNGETKSTYDGFRRGSAVLAWIERSQRPAVSEVDAQSLNTFKTADETVFIAFLNSDDEALRAEFNEVAARYSDEFTFGVVKDAVGAEAEGLTRPALKCYKAVDGDTKLLTSFEETDAIDKFVRDAWRPIISELTKTNHQRLLDRGWSMVYVFAPTEQQRKTIRGNMQKMARSYYDTLTIVVVDPLDFPELPAKLGLSTGEFPSGAVHQLSKDRIYPYPLGQPVDSESFQRWGLNVWQSRVQPWNPPGATTTYSGPPGVTRGSTKVSIRTHPGLKIRVGGHDEL